MEKEKRKVKCVNCGYIWDTKTQLLYISCPNCRRTNKVNDAIECFKKGIVGKVEAGE